MLTIVQILIQILKCSTIVVMCKLDIKLSVICKVMEFYCIVPFDDSAKWVCVEEEQDHPNF